jgi:hypothetical protein
MSGIAQTATPVGGDVRFGSKADMNACRHECPLYPQKRTFWAVNCDVCFTSKADIRSCERYVR